MTFLLAEYFDGYSHHVEEMPLCFMVIEKTRYILV